MILKLVLRSCSEWLNTTQNVLRCVPLRFLLKIGSFSCLLRSRLRIRDLTLSRSTTRLISVTDPDHSGFENTGGLVLANRPKNLIILKKRKIGRVKHSPKEITYFLFKLLLKNNCRLRVRGLRILTISGCSLVCWVADSDPEFLTV